jgi:ankyrin repeat protein
MAFLLKKGANPNIKNKNGYTPIMLAPSVEMARLLLSKGAIIEKATINIPSVIRAGRTNNLELLEFWRDQGADLASQTTQAKGRTLFLDLCFFFSSEKTIAIELLEYLFGLGADINAFDVDNENALMYACRHSKEELVKWLIEHDANLDHRRFNRGKSETALSIACSTGPDYTIIDLLLAGGCTVPNDFNNAYIRIKLEQKSALYEAVVSGDLQTVQQLIAEGGNLWIDVKTHTGDFLIDISNRLDNKNIYNFLISKSKKKSPTKTTKSARKI